MPLGYTCEVVMDESIGQCAIQQQDAAPQAAAAGPMGGSGDANDVGNDGLTHTQRQVKSVLDSERHRENPDGLTADQVCTGVVMLSVCYTCAPPANPSLAVRADAVQMSSGSLTQSYA